MAKQAGSRPGSPNSPTADEIPDKLYFRIGEVANLCKVETYVLRFWQTEFPQLKPAKSGTGQRLYRRRDVEMALRIKRLLHEEGYTIAGARQVFAAEALEHRQSSHAGVPGRKLKPRTQPELPLIPSPDAAETREALDRAADRAQGLLGRLRLELGEIHGLLSRAPSPRAAEEVSVHSRALGKKHSPGESNLFGNQV